MNREKALKRWVDADLLSQEQADAIAEYEQEHASASWVLYGLTGLGITVTLLGVLSIIAANWSEISDPFKLFSYFVVLGGLGYGAYRRLGREGVLRESLLTAFGLFVLAGIGLVGQVYHLESDGYSGLFLWLGLIFPITLIAESRLLGNVWFIGLITAVCMWNAATVTDDVIIRNAGISLSLPYLFIALGYLLHPRFDFFATAARVWGFAVLLFPFAIAGSVAWAHGKSGYKPPAFGVWPYVPIFAAVIAYGAARFRGFRKSSLMTHAIGVVFLATTLLTIPPLVRGLSFDHPIVGCGLFIVAWSGAAAIAAAMERKRLFDIAALVIGVRFVIVYFEVFGSLAATGFGLILSGGVILGIAYGWFKYRRVVAKALSEAA